jgi:hypothetical protein
VGIGVLEGAVVRNCRRIERMGVIHKVGIIDYFVNSHCRGGRGSGVGEGEADKKRERRKRRERKKLKTIRG